jgi:hypothetical protein
MSYATISELRLQIDKTGSTGPSSTPALQLLLDAATEAIDSVTNHPDGFVSLTTATARVYPGSGKAYQFIDECTSITTVAVKESISGATYTAWVAARPTMA